MKALIIGCGNIGAFYDTPNNSKGVFTHAHAYTLLSDIKSIAFYDTNQNKALLATNLWGGTMLANLNHDLSDYKPDIVSVCTPTKYHLETILELLKLHIRPKIILLEKPLSYDLETSKTIVSLLESNGILSNINFSRNFDTSIHSLRNSILKYDDFTGIYGNAIYSKGFLNGGSHLISMLSFLFGNILDFKILSGKNDFDDSDPSLDLWLSFEKCPSYTLMATNHNDYFLCEYSFYFPNKRLSFYNLGFDCLEQEVIASEVFQGYRALSKGNIFNTSLNRSMLTYIDNSIRSLSNPSLLIMPASLALNTQIICDQILTQYKGL